MDRTKTLARSVLALGLAAPALGFAASDETIIEQIIVTAQKRASALQDVPFSVAARERAADPRLGLDQHRRPVAQLRRSHDHRPRPRAEPGRDPRHQRGPGRARPGRRREGVGRRVPGRVGDLAGAVHARSRPVRPGALRGAARPAGHAVRRRLLGGHGALHHAPAAARTVRRRRRSGRLHGHRRRLRRQPARRRQPADRRDRRRCALVGYYNELAGFIDSVYPGPRRARRREQRREVRRARRAAVPAERDICRSRRASSTRSWRPTAIRASTSTTSSATRSRRRSRR